MPAKASKENIYGEPGKPGPKFKTVKAQTGRLPGKRDAQSVAHRPTTPFTPTDEQLAIWKSMAIPNFCEESSSFGPHIFVTAYAGTGKTTTAQYGVQVMPPHEREVCTYLAFMKRNVEEARPKFQDTGVGVSTFHSACFARCRENLGRVRVDDKGQKLKDYINRNRLPWVGVRSNLSKLAGFYINHYLVNETGHRLREILTTHADNAGMKVDSALTTALDHIERYVQWSAAQTDMLTFDEMLFLCVTRGWGVVPEKEWATAILDEVQDFNPIQHELVMMDAKQGVRMVAIGDPHQCQPPDTMVQLTGGRVKRIADIEVGDEVVSYDRRAHRFVGTKAQGRKVTAVAHRKYNGELIGVNGSWCTPNHKWMVRWGDRGPDTWVTYIMRRGESFRVGWCQLFDSQGNFHLGQRARIEKADAAWILEVFTDKASASIAEQLVSIRYGIPTLTFQEINGSHLYTQDVLDRFWEVEGPMLRKGTVALLAFNKLEEYPIWKGGYERHGRTTVFETQACNLEHGMMVPVRDDRDNLPRWTMVDLDRRRYVGEVYSLDIDTHHKYVADGVLTCNSIYGFRGAVSNGMEVLKRRLLDEVTARAVVEHKLTLTQRCCPEIVEWVGDLVPGYRSARPRREEGSAPVTGMKTGAQFLAEAQPADMVVSRVNSVLVQYAYRLVDRNRPVCVVGRDVSGRLTNALDKVMVEWERAELVGAGGQDLGQTPTYHGAIDAWYNFERARLLNEGASETRLANLYEDSECLRWIRVPDDVMSKGRDAVIQHAKGEVDRLFSSEPKPGFVSLSTVHKAKGLEGKTVWILGPEKFLRTRPGASEEDVRQEMNVMYVAKTRGMDAGWLVVDGPGGVGVSEAAVSAGSDGPSVPDPWIVEEFIDDEEEF